MSSQASNGMLFTTVYFLDYLSPICRAFFLAEVLRDGIVNLCDTIMYILENQTLALHHALTSHSYMSLTLTNTDDEDEHTVPRNTFPFFPFLPTELRQLIWSFAIQPPSGRLFHIEALRRADFGRTEAHWAFYQRRGKPGRMMTAMCPNQQVPYIAASCKEAYEVVRQHCSGKKHTQTPPPGLQLTASEVPMLDNEAVVTTTESFRPSSDILYIDALCLGCLPSPQVARNRIRTLASPRQGREVETIALEKGSLWSSAIGTNDSSVKPAVRREVLRAICEEFAGVQKVILLGSRQCEKRKRAGVWGRLWGGERRRTKRENEAGCEGKVGESDGKVSSAVETGPTGGQKAKMGELCGAFTGGAGMHLAFHSAVHGFANLLGWTLGDGRVSLRPNQTRIPCRTSMQRRSRRFMHQIATEKECCKTLPVCLLEVQDFEELPEHILSDCEVDDDMESGHGVDEIEAVQTVLGKLLVDGDISRVPVVQRKVIVRSAGCTGPWSYRTGMARESCSNDDWYWQRKRMEQPVWSVADGRQRIEYL